MDFNVKVSFFFSGVFKKFTFSTFLHRSFMAQVLFYMRGYSFTFVLECFRPFLLLNDKFHRDNQMYASCTDNCQYPSLDDHGRLTNFFSSLLLFY